MTGKQVIKTPYTLGKNERLKSRKLIGQVFREGKSIISGPFRVLYLLSPDTSFQLQAGFSASKRNFKKAVDRNRVKRLMREAYRLKKHSLQTALENTPLHLSVFFIYTGKELPDFHQAEEKISLAIQSLIVKTSRTGK